MTPSLTLLLCILVVYFACRKNFFSHHIPPVSFSSLRVYTCWMHWVGAYDVFLDSVLMKDCYDSPAHVLYMNLLT